MPSEQTQSSVMRIFGDLEWLRSALAEKRYTVLANIAARLLAIRFLEPSQDNFLFVSSILRDIASTLMGALSYKVPDAEWKASVDLITDDLKLVRDGLIRDDRNIIFEGLLSANVAANRLLIDVEVKAERLKVEEK